MKIRFHIREEGANAPVWQDVEINEDGEFFVPALDLNQFITYGQVLEGH